MMFEAGRIARVVLDWVLSQPSIRGLALVGSHVRGDARPESDIDFMAVAIDADDFKIESWPNSIRWPDMHVTTWQDETYGIVWSRRIFFEPHGEVEISFGPISWAAINPVDAGTQRVVSGGFGILHDPDRLLNKLQDVCL